MAFKPLIEEKERDFGLKISNINYIHAPSNAMTNYTTTSNGKPASDNRLIHIMSTTFQLKCTCGKQPN